jgi:hypothetical protein
MAPKNYIERIIDSYVRMFGEHKKKKVQSSIDKDARPELETPELINADCITKYQSLVGKAQWTVSLRRFDIPFVVMTLSSLRSMTRVGHLELARRVCAYLGKFPGAKIQFKTGVMDHKDVTPIDLDAWSRSVYGDVKEEVPNNAPKPCSKVVTCTQHFDASLYRNFQQENQSLVYRMWSRKKCRTTHRNPAPNLSRLPNTLMLDCIESRYCAGIIFCNWSPRMNLGSSCILAIRSSLPCISAIRSSSTCIFGIHASWHVCNPCIVGIHACLH